MKRKLISALIVLLCIPLAFFLFTEFLGSRADRESHHLAQQSIQRAAVQCYALEGAYPTSLTHLEARYGVSVDEAHFLVDYRYIASNLMPDITVLPMG